MISRPAPIHALYDIFLLKRPAHQRQKGDSSGPHCVHPCWLHCHCVARESVPTTPLSVRSAASLRALPHPPTSALQRRFRTPSYIGQTSTASLPLPGASAPGASAASRRPSSRVTGTPSRSCARQPPLVSQPSAVVRRAGGSSRPPPPSTTRSPAPPSPAEDGGALQPSPCRSPLSMARVSRSRATEARTPQTVTSPCPLRPARCGAPPGPPLSHDLALSRPWARAPNSVRHNSCRRGVTRSRYTIDSSATHTGAYPSFKKEGHRPGALPSALAVKGDPPRVQIFSPAGPAL